MAFCGSREDSRFEWKIMLGTALLVAGAVLAWNAQPQGGVQSVMGAVGAALVAAGVILLLRTRLSGKRPVIDERVKKLSNKAYAYAWYASFFLVAVLIWTDVIWPNTITVQGVLGLMLFFMSASGIAFKWWFESRPEAV